MSLEGIRHIKSLKNDIMKLIILLDRKMYNMSNIFLASNDVTSKLKFPENNNMEFTINLPQRYSFGKWEVCLKSITIPSGIYNIYEDNELSWTFEMIKEGLFITDKYKAGYYEVKYVLKVMDRTIHKAGGPVKIFYDKKKKSIRIKFKETKLKDTDVYKFYLHGNMFRFLGFSLGLTLSFYLALKE